MDGDDTVALEQRAAAAVQVQDWNTAIEIGEQLLATEPNGQRASFLADALSSAGRHTDIVVTLEDQRLDEIELSEIERRGLLHRRLNALQILNQTDSQTDDLAATTRAILDLDNAPDPEERHKLANVLIIVDDLAGARAQLELIEAGADADLQDSIAVATWAVDLLEGDTGEINDDAIPHVRQSIELIAGLRGRDVVAVLRRAVDGGLAEAEAGKWAMGLLNNSLELDRSELAEQLWWFVSEVSPIFMLEPSFVDAGLTLRESTRNDRFVRFEELKARRPGEAPLVDIGLAQRLRDTGHDAEWGRFAQAAATANTAHLTAHGLLGSALAQAMLGDLPKTARTLEILAEADPALADQKVVRVMRVMMIGSGIGDVERAKEDLTAVRGHLAEYQVTFAEAGIATAEKRLDDAEHLYRTVIEQADAADSPDGVQTAAYTSHIALGNNALERGDFDAARVSFTAASDISPDKPTRALATTLVGLAIGRKAQAAEEANKSRDVIDKLYDESITKIEEGIGLAAGTPIQAMTRWMLGVVLWGAGRPEEALLHLRPVADDEEAQEMVRLSAAITAAETLSVLEDPDGAIEYYKRATQLATDGGKLAQIVAGIGRAEIARGRYDEAVAALRAGVDRSPNDATLWRVLGQAYSAATRHHAAAFSYRRAWRLDASVQHALGLSEQLLLAGQKEEALAFLNDPKIRDLGDDELNHNRTLAGGDGGDDSGDGSARTGLPPWPELWLGRGWVMRIAGLVLLVLIVLAIVPYVFHVEERSGFGWLNPDRSDLASAVGLLVLVALLVLPYGLKFKAAGIEIEAGPSGPSPDRPEPKLEAIRVPIGPG